MHWNLFKINIQKDLKNRNNLLRLQLSETSLVVQVHRDADDGVRNAGGMQSISTATDNILIMNKYYIIINSFEIIIRTMYDYLPWSKGRMGRAPPPAVLHVTWT